MRFMLHAIINFAITFAGMNGTRVMSEYTFGQFRRIGAFDRPALAIEIDGQQTPALEGDTVLTALLLNHRTLRKFEFGDEQRGGFCLIGACQDCWVLLGSGARIRACTTSVREGMCVRTGRDN